MAFPTSSSTVRRRRWASETATVAIAAMGAKNGTSCPIDSAMP